jgi:hypothetical protein
MPRKDWASHGSAAFRYLAMGLRPATLSPRPAVREPPMAYSFTAPERRIVGPRPGLGVAMKPLWTPPS